MLRQQSGLHRRQAAEGPALPHAALRADPRAARTPATGCGCSPGCSTTPAMRVAAARADRQCTSIRPPRPATARGGGSTTADRPAHRRARRCRSRTSSSATWPTRPAYAVDLADQIRARRAPRRHADGPAGAAARRAHRHGQLPLRRLAARAGELAAGADASTGADGTARASRRPAAGLYLGAYGWLEDVRPKPGTLSRAASCPTRAGGRVRRGPAAGAATRPTAATCTRRR